MAKDVEITFFKAGGPGGQHRNKTETGVRLKHLPTGLVATATERRTRRQNLEAAFERLERKLAAARHRPKPRHRTAPTRASVERRLEGKRRRAGVKRDRRADE